MVEETIWAIRAGRNSEADSLFLKRKCVALGWGKIGDLSKLAADREAFKAAIATEFPEYKPGAVPTRAGQIFRFVHEIKVGDLVVYPSKLNATVYVGRITGPYEYNPKPDDRYPNQRAVEWLKSVPRTQFSQGALYEMGSALSLFTVKNYSDEIWAVLEGKGAVAAPTEDTSAALVVEEIEQSTKDFIVKTLAQELKGHKFAEFVAHLLSHMGYRTRVSPPGPDGGVDIVAHRDELGFEPPIIKVQVKSTEGSVGDPVVSSLYGKVAQSEFGLLVTLGTFTKQAIAFADNKSNLRLIDGDEVVETILRHYEGFDAAYKGILPLKRVYVPQVVKDDEE